MVLPAGVTTCLVFKNAPVGFGGAVGGVEFEITPSVRLVHTATGTPLVDFIESVSPADGGVAQMMLPHTDQDGFQDEAGNAFKNWHYTARVRLKKTGNQPKHEPLFDFQIPSGQALVDLSTIPRGVAALPTSAPVAVVTSINGKTGPVDTFLTDAKHPEDLWTGTRTVNSSGAVTSSAVTWPDGTTGVYTGTPSTTFPGSIDSYTITKGATTYTQPTVTRDSNGNITLQPAITVS